MAKLKSLEVEGTTNLNNVEISDKTNILEMIYPIGAVYISTVYANPQDLFGFGEWEYLPDRFLLGAGNTFQIGTTGGEINHTLTTAEMPSHTHSVNSNFTITIGGIGGSGSSGIPNATAGWGSYGNAHWSSFSAGNTGSGVAHNNMPPYLVVYMWKRTA